MQSEEVKDDFSKGVVFYTKGGVVVGVLTWNIFGKMDLARKVCSVHNTHTSYMMHSACATIPLLPGDS